MLTLRAALLIAAAAALAPAGAATLWVAPTGDDSAPGSAQQPLATLQRAVELARPLLAGADPVVIALRAGVYRLAAPVVLGTQDSGLTIQAAPGEEVVLSGGRVVSGWTPWRDGILQADLSGLELPDLAFRELYYAGQRQPLARVPNLDPAHPRVGGFLRCQGVVEPGSATRFRYPAGTLDPTRWTHPERALVVSHTSVNYENTWAPLVQVDAGARTLEAAWGVYAVEDSDRFYVCGLLEELDAPGEWYVDPEARRLYFMPPTAGPGEVVVPALTSAFVLQGATAQDPVRGVRLVGLHLRDLRGDAVAMTRAQDCTVAACDLRNVGVGVSIGLDTQRCQVLGCDITQTLGDGVAIVGLPGEHERTSDHRVDNNYIWDFGHGDIHNRCGGVWMIGCARCRVTHNHVHDGPRYAIGMDVGNDNEIAWNYGHHVNLTTCDTGIIEGATAWDWGKPDELERNQRFNAGNSIHHNLLHDSGGWGKAPDGQPLFPTFSWGIYLDLHASRWRVYDNVVYNTVLGGFMLNCGQDNVVQNNVFVDGKESQVQFNPWPKYTISGNRCERNIISYAGEAAALYTLNGFQDDFCAFDRNFIQVRDARPPRVNGVPGLQSRRSWAQWLERGQDAGSALGDPYFADPETRDYRLSAESPAIALGIEPLDLTAAGNYASPERHSWPRPEEPVVREAADYAPGPTEARQPTLRDYESCVVGETERGAHVGVEAGRSAIAVTDEVAVSGRQSLKFTDAPGQQHSFVPYATYMVEVDEGRWHGGLDLRVEAGADFVYEWRDDPQSYSIGPNLHVTPAGDLLANGQLIRRLEPLTWVRLDVTCGLADLANGTYDLTVQVAGEPPQEYRGLKCDAPFAELSCVVIMGIGETAASFWVDNLQIEKLP